MHKKHNRIFIAALLGIALALPSLQASLASPVPASAGPALPRILTQLMPGLNAWLHSVVLPSQRSAADRLRNDLPLEAALPEARRAMRAGHAARARHLAQRVVAHMSPADPQYVHALDQAGYACWVVKDYVGAIKYLEQADENAPHDPLSPWRRAWLADAAFRTAAYDDAIEWAEKTHAVGAEYLAVHLANAAAARAHAAHTKNPAPERLHAFLQRYPEYPESRNARVELAESWLRVGGASQAAHVVDHALQHYPWTPQARRLNNLLDAHPDIREHLPTYSPLEQLERAKIWRNLRQWDTVEQRLLQLEAHAISTNDDELLGQIRFELAMNAMEIGDYPRADERFRRLKQNDWTGIEAWEGLRYYGWNQARLGKHNEALKTLKLSAKKQGGQDGADALFEYLYDLGEYDAARDAYPHVSREETLDPFRVVMMQYLSGDHRGARDAWLQMAKRTGGHAQNQAEYWAGRAALHMGDVPAARKLWSGIVERNPVDYYGLLGASRIADLDVANLHKQVDAKKVRLRHLPGRAHWHGADNSEPADFRVAQPTASKMTAYADSLPAPEPLQELTEKWGTLLPDLHRAQALVRIGADEDARHLYRRVVQEVQQIRKHRRAPTGDSPISLRGDRWAHMIDNRRGDEKKGWWGIELNTPAYPAIDTREERRKEVKRQRDIRTSGEVLTDALIDIGRHLESHHVVRQLVLKERGLRGTPPTQGDRGDWFEAYPRPFPLTVVTHTRRANLNPYLLWATIIVESNMNPDAISHASAYGLTQVIPKTGDRLAWELGDSDFGIHSLLDPHVSIRYGAWYLGKLTAKFGHQESLALVGYNAGPHRVARWMDWRGRDLDADEFHEMIPFRGARNYQKQILRYMATYQMLYEDALRIYIGLELMLDYDDAVNF